MRPELIVAGKEFRDHLASKRFLAIFVILILLAIISMANGMDQYNKSLEQYKTSQAQIQQQQWYKDQISSLQAQISNATANGLSSDQIQSLRQQLEDMINPSMPSVLTVFSVFSDSGSFGGGYFTLILMFLSIALGFDLITREKEEGSLKSLLSHPVYRDAVINGKLIGAMAILVVAMGCTFLITIAIMLFFGVVPTVDDLLRIATFFILALLFCGVFFAIAALFSTIAKTSAMSILCVFGVIIALAIIPSFAPTITNLVVGAPPEAPAVPQGGGGIYYPMLDSNSSGGSGDVSGGTIMPVPVPIEPPTPTGIDKQWQDYYNATQVYYQKQQTINDAINTISPIYDFGNKIFNSIMYKQGGQITPILYGSMKAPPYYVPRQPTLLDSLSYVWNSILALLVEMAVPLALSYVVFMRSDIR